MKKLFTLISFALLSFVSSFAFAAVAEPEPPAAPPAQCDLAFATGAPKKGYSNAYANIHEVCPQIPVCEQNSEGGLENLSLLNEKKADVALTGVNTLQTMIATDDQLKQIQVVASLHSNLLHVMTLAAGFDFQETATEKSKFFGLSKEVVPGAVMHLDINKFSDLKGRSVGLVGSAQLAARKLNSTSGHNMQFVDFATDAEAVKALKAKPSQIVAVLSMAAWPHGFVNLLKQDSGIKLVPYDLQPMPPFTAMKKNYKGLGQFGVDFLAEPNVLVTRPFAPGGVNAKNVAALKACIASKLPSLKDGKFEPSWGEVTDLNQTFGLPAFAGQPAASLKKK